LARTFRPPRALVPRKVPAAPRVPTIESTPPRKVEAAVGFIDLAGFTALAEKHGDFDAADTATRFAELARAALGAGDRLIKTIGDAVLVTSATPGDALDLTERLFASAAEEKTLPALRAGWHHGTVIERDGDIFGRAVNLAARVAGEAYAGEVIVTASIAAEARARGLPVVDIGPVALKNVRDVAVLSSIGFMVGATESAVDPVCQAVIDRRSAAGQLRHEHEVYWFCSLTCAAAFASNPHWHAAAANKDE
jgi:class 3 adenylate cyclase/YHS domain-containing protein